jgi:glucokinase
MTTAAHDTRLGVDIGGTNVRVAAVSASTGAVLSSARAGLVDRSPAGVTSLVAKLAHQVAQAHDAATPPVGVGFAGMLRDGVVLNAPNLGWRNVAFATELSVALDGRSVRLVNDLSAAAWGERVAGASRGADDVLTIFVGTGVGSAIIARGALVEGASGVAGEFGHIKVELSGGRACGCGDVGCLEAYAGGARLIAWMQEQRIDGGPGELEALALSGHRAAQSLYDSATNHLALAIANQVSMLNPSVVVLGGGVLSNCPGMVRRVVEVVEARATAASRDVLRIVMATLGDDSGIVGAALLAQAG